MINSPIKLTPAQKTMLNNAMKRYLDGNGNRAELYLRGFNPNSTNGIGINRIYLPSDDEYDYEDDNSDSNMFLYSGNGKANINTLLKIKNENPALYYNLVDTYFTNMRTGNNNESWSSPEEFGLAYYYNPYTNKVEFSYSGNNNYRDWDQISKDDTRYSDIARFYQHQNGGKNYYYYKDKNGNIDYNRPVEKNIGFQTLMNGLTAGGDYIANYDSDFLNRGNAKEVNEMPNDPTKQAYGGYSGYRRYDDGGMMPPDQGMGGGSPVDQVLAMLSQLPPDQLQQVVQALMQMAQGGGMPQGDPSMGGMPPEQGGMPPQGMMAYGGYNRYANGGNIQRTREQRLNYAFGGLINKYRK